MNKKFYVGIHAKPNKDSFGKYEKYIEYPTYSEAYASKCHLVAEMQKKNKVSIHKNNIKKTQGIFTSSEGEDNMGFPCGLEIWFTILITQ